MNLMAVPTQEQQSVPHAAETLLTIGSAQSPATLQRLLLQYELPVKRLSSRLMGWNGDVDDVVQDVFVIALERAGQFRGDASVWTWLTAITINRCRARMRRRAIYDRILGRVKQWTAASSPPADDRVAEKEVGSRVRSAVAALPARDREVIVLYYLEERSAAEIAEALGLTANAVDVRLHRARAKLKALLADEPWE